MHCPFSIKEKQEKHKQTWGEDEEYKKHISYYVLIETQDELAKKKPLHKAHLSQQRWGI